MTTIDILGMGYISFKGSNHCYFGGWGIYNLKAATIDILGWDTYHLKAATIDIIGNGVYIWSKTKCCANIVLTIWFKYYKKYLLPSLCYSHKAFILKVSHFCTCIYVLFKNNPTYCLQHLSIAVLVCPILERDMVSCKKNYI